MHELDDISHMIDEVTRIIKPGGTLAVIEFHKWQTMMGPLLSDRLSEIDITASLSGKPFELKDSFVLGNNLYCVQFTKR